MTEAEKAYQYFVIAVPENEEQAKAYFWARKALKSTLTQPNEWVSVDERLPTDERPVLVFVGYADTMTGFITTSSYFCFDANPLEERLPEEGKRCLLYTPCDGILCVGYYAGKDEWQHRHKWRLVTAMRSTQTLTKKVTHWMPLPAPPKEVKKR